MVNLYEHETKETSSFFYFISSVVKKMYQSQCVDITPCNKIFKDVQIMTAIIALTALTKFVITFPFLLPYYYTGTNYKSSQHCLQETSKT